MSAAETEPADPSAGAWVVYYVGMAALLILTTAVVYTFGGLPATLAWAVMLPVSIAGVRLLL